jgi:mRNA interferase RelE/StbE
VARYSLKIKQSAIKELERIGSRADRQRIVAQIEKLAEEPRPPGAKKLSGSERYRIRQGRFRIVYSIEDEVLVVYVIRIADRKDVYRSR